MLFGMEFSIYIIEYVSTFIPVYVQKPPFCTIEKQKEHHLRCSFCLFLYFCVIFVYKMEETQCPSY